MEVPLSLKKLNDCGFLKHNQTAPGPSPLVGDSRLQTNSVNLYFDHEYGGFSKVMRVEMAKAVPPSDYHLKFVIQDVFDRSLDSAIFFPDDGVRLFTFAQGDFNRDGSVDAADYTIWADNNGYENFDVTFEDGDANGDFYMNIEDYTLWAANFGETGHIDYCADFNRDGVVDDMDEVIINNYLLMNLTECASRFEGDADEDGDVDQCDYDIWEYEFDTGLPLRPCACQSGAMGRTAGGDTLATSCLEAVLIDKAARKALEANRAAYRQALRQAAEAIRSELPKSPDTNGDGEITETDRAVVEAIIAKHLEESLAAAGETAPSLAPPVRIVGDEEGESP